jgi:hypothetical protein
MPGDEELDDDWDPAKAEEGPNSKRATIRVPDLAVSPSQPPTVRPSQSQVDADELKPPEEPAPKT